MTAPDRDAPVTTISGVPSGWTSATVTFSLAVTDTGGDVVATYYRLDGGAGVPYVAPVAVAKEGVTSVAFNSVDRAGNVEPTHGVEVQIDKSPPVASIDATNAFNAPAVVHFAAEDALSGVAAVFWRLDGGSAHEGAVVAVPAFGDHAVTCWAVDNAGNASAPRTMAFAVRDTIAPVTVSDAASSYIGTAAIGLAATDGGSGVAATFFKLDGAAAVEGTRAVTSALGPHTLEFWSTDRAGNAEAHHSVTFDVVTSAVRALARVSGADRYATAIAMSASRFATGSAGAVVLATGGDFPDALCAAGLAGAVHAPVLLTHGAYAPDPTLAEALRVTSGVAAPTAYIVGSERAVGKAVVDRLKAEGFTVVRYGGADRYATAAVVARAISRLEGSRFARRAFVARGDAFPDALAVGPFAYSQRFPILLVRTTALPPVTAKAITDLGIRRIVIAGGTAAVSDAVVGRIDDLAGVDTPVRKGGAGRYDTAIAVTEYGIAMGWGDVTYVGVATGADYPDALAGCSIAGARGGVLLLTDPRALSPQTAAFISARKDGILTCAVYGSDRAVTAGVYGEIEALLR